MEKKAAISKIKNLADTFIGFIRTSTFRWIIIPVLLVLTGFWSFLTLGYDADDMRKGAGWPEGKFKLTSPFSSNELSEGLYFQLDWDEAPIFAEIYDILDIPGKVSVCILDRDARRVYSALICDEGVRIEKSRFKILRASLSKRCLSTERKEFMGRTIGLLLFAVDYVINIRGNASLQQPNSGTYARLSHAPLQDQSLFKACNEASAKPLSVTGWLKFVFVDLRSISNYNSFTKLYRTYRDVRSPVPHELNETVDSIEPLFRFGKNNRLAKFGVKKFEIDDYGDPVDGTVKYEVIEVEYDESMKSWNLRGKPIIQPVSADVDLVMEVGLVVRLIIYVVLSLIAIMFFAWTIRKIFF